jgi:hypothetical protein
MSEDPVAEFENKYAAGIPLASGAEEDVSEQFGGFFYNIPKGGQTFVRDKMRHKLDKKQMPILSEPLVIDEPATAIVRELLAPDRLGCKGVFVVMNDGKDDERRAAGRERWMKWRSSKALGIQAWWMKYSAEAKATPHALPPVMPQHVRTEIDFLRRHAQEIHFVGRKRYICTLDGNDFDSYDECLSYVANLFGAELRQQNDVPAKYVQDNQQLLASAISAGKKAREESAVPPVETSVVALEDGSKTLDEAVAKKVKLTRAERKALLDGDADTIKAVREQISQAPEVSA